LSSLHLHNLSKSFGELQAVAPTEIEIREGEFFSLLGPSGCGKTTLLRMIAGLEPPSSGTIVIDGVDITSFPPQKRNIGIVFQNYALFPHMSVFENVAYGLEVKKIPRNEIRAKVEHILEKVHLSEKAEISVPLLSGGEQQRVAVARAVVVEPGVLLFDEPLSNLDYALRLETRAEIKRLQREVGITTIYVTHDQGEALALSDRIAVLKNGIVQQVGTPDELYFHPGNAFTASFIGHANLFSPEICKEYFNLTMTDAKELLAVLPEEIVLSDDSGKAQGRIVDKQFSGANVEYAIDFVGQLVKAIRSSSDRGFNGEVGGLATIAFAGSIQRRVNNE
jgi:iron(III) transport system ATP-binding protein